MRRSVDNQQQRVLLARALCATEKALLLDEPVSGLDPHATEQMYELVDKLNKQDGITVIMISHDLEAALEYSNKVLHIGKKIFFGSKQEYLDRLDKTGFVSGKGGESNG